MENMIEKLPFIINPHLRLHSFYFRVNWIMIEDYILQIESSFIHKDKKVYLYQKRCNVIVHYEQGVLDIIYSERTNWEIISLQHWLRKTIRDHIILRAEEILPDRLHYWEQQKGIYARKVTVSHRLRRKVLGLCTSSDEIRLAPVIVLFPLRCLDEVILHEMAHLKHRNHRAAFWKYLSLLLGRDARQSNADSDMFLSRYADMFFFIMK